MKTKLLFLIIGISIIACTAKLSPDYIAEINNYRKKQQSDLLTYHKGPIIPPKDTSSLSYYPINGNFVIQADCYHLDGKETITMPTSAGTEKTYIKHSRYVFTIEGITDTLTAYQSTSKYLSNQLFVPFRDATSGLDTYGGGRYLELTPDQCKDGHSTIDFNKSYNPWCVYSNGFFCPLPPKENDLQMAIKAGEKMFLKQ